MLREEHSLTDILKLLNSLLTDLNISLYLTLSLRKIFLEINFLLPIHLFPNTVFSDLNTDILLFIRISLLDGKPSLEILQMEPKLWLITILFLLKPNGEFNLESLYYYHTEWMDKEVNILQEDLKDF